jgi:hypothetical protein
MSNQDIIRAWKGEEYRLSHARSAEVAATTSKADDSSNSPIPGDIPISAFRALRPARDYAG